MGLARFAIAGMLLVTATAAVAGDRMRGFDTIAARSERIDITGLSGWHKGRFSLGDTGAGGRYDIRSMRDRSFWESSRYGESSFTLSGPGIDGEYSGRCHFEMVNAQDRFRDRNWKLTISTSVVPLTYRCVFQHDGKDIGMLDLAEIASPGISVKQERAGIVALGDHVLGLHSVHHFEKASLPGASPLGYLIENDGQPIAAIDLNGARKRLALPGDLQLREASLLAGMALALFWDPGDGDD